LRAQLLPTIWNGDSSFDGTQVFVFQYSDTQFSYTSFSHAQFQSFQSSPSPDHQLQQGRAIAVTIQFPAISATGEGILIQALYGPTQMASHNCAVSVGAAYILIKELKGHAHFNRRKLSPGPVGI
jgi:hypothetical protein